MVSKQNNLMDLVIKYNFNEFNNEDRIKILDSLNNNPTINLKYLSYT